MSVASQAMIQLSSTAAELPDDAEVVTDYLHARGFTDGLPVIPPTRERVERFLAATGLDPAQAIGFIPPLYGEATIEKLAINAVMAGCRPEYFAMIVAAVKAMLPASFKLAGLQTTTNPYTPLLIVNGPIRGQIKLNCGTGVMGPGWQANATIGRAVRLILLNLGGAAPGEIDKCTQGFVGKYGLCIGENEEESPWEPLHAERGFLAEQNVVTVVGVNASTNFHDSSDDWHDLVKTMIASLVSPGTANVIHPFSNPVIALNPLHARILSEAGFSKRDVQQYIYDHARLPADGLSKRRAHLRESYGQEYFAVDGGIPFVNNPTDILLVVTGGMQGGHSCYLPAGGYGNAASRPI